MLHGWTQNGEVFRDKTKAFVRKVEKVKSPSAVTLTFAAAPHVLSQDDYPDLRPDARTWFYHHESAKPQSVDVFAPVKRYYHGWTESRAYIADLWMSEGPFDVIIGFSQGAVVTHQLLADIEIVNHHSAEHGGTVGALAAAGFISPSAASAAPDADPTSLLSPSLAHLLRNPPKAAVLVAGFPSRHNHQLGTHTEDSGLQEDSPADHHLLQTPTLHVSASNDATVACAHQDELCKRFIGGTLHRTEQGHAMPQRAGDMAVVCDFLSGIAAKL